MLRVKTKAETKQHVAGTLESPSSSPGYSIIGCPLMSVQPCSKTVAERKSPNPSDATRSDPDDGIGGLIPVVREKTDVQTVDGLQLPRISSAKRRKQRQPRRADVAETEIDSDDDDSVRLLFGKAAAASAPKEEVSESQRKLLSSTLSSTILNEMLSDKLWPLQQSQLTMEQQSLMLLNGMQKRVMELKLRPVTLQDEDRASAAQPRAAAVPTCEADLPRDPALDNLPDEGYYAWDLNKFQFRMLEAIYQDGQPLHCCQIKGLSNQIGVTEDRIRHWLRKRHRNPAMGVYTSNRA